MRIDGLAASRLRMGIANKARLSQAILMRSGNDDMVHPLEKVSGRLVAHPFGRFPGKTVLDQERLDEVA